MNPVVFVRHGKKNFFKAELLKWFDYGTFKQAKIKNVNTRNIYWIDASRIKGIDLFEPSERFGRKDGG